MSRKHVKGEMDLLEGPIWSKLLMLALPIAAVGILQQLFNAADLAVVGSFIEDKEVAKAAMAAVGSNATIVDLIITFFVGISLGTNVIISQDIGGRKLERIRETVSTSIVFSIVGGIIVAVIGELVLNALLSLMLVPEDVFDLAAIYMRIYLIGLPLILLYNFETAIFRSVGNTKTPLYVLTASGILNVILNLIFVVVFKMTVDGVALATVISNVLSAIVLFILLCRSKTEVRIDLHYLKIDLFSLKQILKIGVPAGFQGMMFSIANICIQAVINSLGTVIMAANSAALNIEYLSFFFINSFAQACTTVTGQNYGAGQYGRCQETLKTTLVFSYIMLGLYIAIVFLLGRPLLTIFSTDPEIIHYGMLRLEYMILGLLFIPVMDVYSGYLRGFGISMTPALGNLVCICGFRLLWIYFVFPHFPTFEGIMWVYPISLALTAITTFIIYLVFRKDLEARTELNREKLTALNH